MPSDSQMAESLMAAIRICDQMKTAGETRENIAAYLDSVVRQVWVRTRPWKFYCEECSDTGWHVKTCTPAMRCGRPFKLPKARDDDKTGSAECRGEHSYAEPCFCHKGQKRRAELLKQSTPSDDMDSAAKVRKPTRFGR